MTYSNDVIKLNPSLAGGNGKATVKKNLTVQKGNKYGAIRSYSEFCGRTFDSKAEKVRGEELALLEKVGDIHALQYQVPFKLCEKPKIKVTIDFYYMVFNQSHYEDVKGVLTRDSRTKYAWLEQRFGIHVDLVK